MTENRIVALVKVMPCYSGQDLPVAVFIKYANSNMWQQYSKEYYYPKSAEKKAKILTIEHYGYKLV